MENKTDIIKEAETTKSLIGISEPNKTQSIPSRRRRKPAAKKIEEPTAANIKKTEEELDRRMIKGIFKNYQTPNLLTVFSQRKYPGERITTYKLVDGEMTELPYYVAKSIKQGCFYKRNELYQGTDGVQGVRLSEKIKIMDFFPINEFIPESDEVNNLTTVEFTK